MLGLVIGLGGCKSQPAYQGSKHEILASFRGRKLNADLPSTVRVPAAVAATKGALLQRGYAIKACASTEDAGQVQAEPYDAGILESVIVDVRESSVGTHIQIIVEPTGSQTKSRAILDSILSNLGL